MFFPTFGSGAHFWSELRLNG